MKRFIKTAVVTVILACVYNPLYAHGGAKHTHNVEEISQEKVQAIATQEVVRLAEIKKISRSWLSAPRLNIRKEIFGDKMEWVVSYKNKLLRDKSKQVLYIFVSLDGKVSGANYSGK